MNCKDLNVQDFINELRNAKTESVIDLVYLRSILKACNLDLNETNSWGDTLLWVSVSKSFPKITEMLLDLGADSNLVRRMKPNYTVRDDNEGKTVLIVAAENNNLELLNLLLSRGANPNIGDKLGQTPLFHALDAPPLTQTAKRLGEVSNPANANRYHMTALHFLATTFNADDAKAMILDLISRGANIDATELDGRTPLDKAIEWENQTMIDFLSALGAKTGKQITAR